MFYLFIYFYISLITDSALLTILDAIDELKEKAAANTTDTATDTVATSKKTKNAKDVTATFALGKIISSGVGDVNSNDMLVASASKGIDSLLYGSPC